MKFLQAAVIAGSLCLATSAFASVTLQLPEGLKAVAVNGENSKFSKRVTLPDGVNQIAVRFSKEFGNVRDSDMEYSEAFVVTFKASDETLVLRMPEIHTAVQIDSFNKNPDFHLSTIKGEDVHFEMALLQKDGIQIMRDYAEELKKFNTTTSPAAVHEMRSSSMAVAPASMRLRSGAVDVQGNGGEMNVAESMLHYWYEQADETTRARFKAWLNK